MLIEKVNDSVVYDVIVDWEMAGWHCLWCDMLIGKGQDGMSMIGLSARTLTTENLDLNANNSSRATCNKSIHLVIVICTNCH